MVSKAKSNKEKRAARRKQTAEDFTPAWLVKDMLTKLGVYNDSCWEDPTKTFVDPACGNGNFLVQIAKNKLKNGHKPLDVAKTIFGLDIMQDNVQEARFRLCRVFDAFNCLDKHVVLQIWQNIIKVNDTLGVDFNKAVFRKKKLEEEKANIIIRKVTAMNADQKKMSARRKFLKGYFYNNEHIESIQNIHTPFSLTSSVVKKLGEYTGLKNGKKFLCFNHEFIESLIEQGVEVDNIWYISECSDKVDFAVKIYGVHGICDDFVSWNHGQKFDVVIGNPPYQKPQDAKGKRGGGSTLWDKFVELSIDICKDDGFVSLIHPCGWRAPKGSYKNTQQKMLEYKMHYLEIHNSTDGLKTFGAGTRYDWYVMQKKKGKNKTEILGEDGKTYIKNISDLPFIPNAMFDEVLNLIAKEGESTINILHSYSDYESRKKWISKKETSKFKYPVIHSIKKAGLNLLWSSEDRGMFGIPKVIFGRGQTKLYNDKNGEYAMSQDMRAVVDSKSNLDKIVKAMENEKFIKISQSCTLVSTGMFVDKYNKDVLALFRKDFWKQFI